MFVDYGCLFVFAFVFVVKVKKKKIRTRKIFFVVEILGKEKKNVVVFYLNIIVA